MKLARKLQLAYLSLVLIPLLITGVLALLSYYSGTSLLGPYSDIEAPGWIKAEMSAILDRNWELYSSLDEKIVIFVMDSNGLLVFPDFSENGFSVSEYPHMTGGRTLSNHQSDPSQNQPQLYIAEAFERFGTEWSMDLTFSPVTTGDRKYLVGWKLPSLGIPGLLARKRWFFPMIFLTGIMLIPALVDLRLRQSIRRLQLASTRLSEGDLDEPIRISPKDDLKDLATTLEQTRVELKDARDRKSRFLMAVSHDLRTPLTSIRGYIEALGDGMAGTEDEFRRYLSVLEDKAALLEGRVGELIDFARSDTTGWARPSANINVAGLAADLNAAFAKDCGFHKRKYESDLKIPDHLKLIGDRATLYRAWENLFANAVRHTCEGDTIGFRVFLHSDGRELSGEISDTGEGVDVEFRPHLFEPFSRPIGDGMPQASVWGWPR